MEEGEAVLFNGNGVLTTFSRTADCNAHANHCLTPHETIVWNITEIGTRCPYHFTGTYSALISAEEVIINDLQATFIPIKPPPILRNSCSIINPHLTHNDVILSFPLRESHIKVEKRTDDTHRALIAENLQEEPDETNLHLQYLQEMQIRNNALKWCSIQNKLSQILSWISINDPTAAARILIGRTDISARYVGDLLLVSKCRNITITKAYWNHQPDDHCYEWLPVKVEGTVQFINPVTREVEPTSRRIPCPWIPPPKSIENLPSPRLIPLLETETKIIFNLSKHADLTRKLLQLAVDRLERGRLPEPAQQQLSEKKHIWRTSAEELLHELGHEFSTATEEIENALDTIASRWRLIICGTAAVGLFIVTGVCIIYCKVLPLCHTKARKEVIIQLNNCKPREEGQVEEGSSGSMENANKSAASLKATYVPFRILPQ